MTYLSVLQHTSADYLGLMEDHLEGRGTEFKYYRPFTEGTPLPTPENVGDGLIVLGGGPWGTAGGRDIPSLKKELDLVHNCIMTGKPVLAVGAGTQLLAMAAGGGSEDAPLEFKVETARRVVDDALGGMMPETFPMVSYMRDRPVLPDYAKVLAEDEEGHPAVFQVGENCLGFVGHPGVKSAIIEDLIMEFDESAPDPVEKLAKLAALNNEIEDKLVYLMTGIVNVCGFMKLGGAFMEPVDLDK